MLHREPSLAGRCTGKVSPGRRALPRQNLPLKLSWVQCKGSDTGGGVNRETLWGVGKSLGHKAMQESGVGDRH